jgi:hypothetical protein
MKLPNLLPKKFPSFFIILSNLSLSSNPKKLLVRKDTQYIHTHNTTFPSDLSSQQQTNKKQQTKQTNDKQEHQE